jgi:hypothetical protein
VITGVVLLKFPAVSLFRVMVMTTAGTAVTGACQAAIFERDCVLVVAAGGLALTGRPIAGAVPDLDEVAEFIAGVVGGGLVPVIAVADREIASAAASSSAQNLPHGSGTPACPARARPVAGRRRISPAAADSRPAAAHDSVRCQAVRTPTSSWSLTPV